MSTSPAAPTVAASLQLRRVAIDTYRENVAYLHRDCAVYRAEGFQALSKIEVRANGRRILATVNVVDDPAIVGCHELGLSEDAFAQLGVEPGYKVAVAQAEPPESMGALFRKIAGERLAREDFPEAQRLVALIEKVDPSAPALPRLKQSLTDAQASFAQRQQQHPLDHEGG